MDTPDWPKKIMVKPMEDIIIIKSSPNSCSNVISTNNNNDNDIKAPSTTSERKAPPQKDEAVNCPRCSSTNTKFCYYNNYSLTQPRYFCKACKRYWTEGGSLRNIPVGGGSRKNKRPSSSPSSFESPSTKRISSHHDLESQHLNNTASNANNKFLSQQAQYLNLGFPSTPNPTQQHFTSLSQFIQLPSMEPTSISNGNTSATPPLTVDHPQHQLSAMELLHGLTSSRGLTPYIPMSVPNLDPDPDPNTNDVYSSGYPSLNFSLDGHGHGNGYGNLHAQQRDVQNSGGRMLFPFEDLKQVSSTTNIDDDDDGDGDHNANTNTNNNHDDDEQDRDVNGESTNGYWSGMLGNGGSW